MSLSQTAGLPLEQEKFCDACHQYSGVEPKCWSCHAVPKEGGMSFSRGPPENCGNLPDRRGINPPSMPWGWGTIRRQFPSARLAESGGGCDPTPQMPDGVQGLHRRLSPEHNVPIRNLKAR